MQRRGLGVFGFRIGEGGYNMTVWNSESYLLMSRRDWAKVRSVCAEFTGLINLHVAIEMSVVW